MYKDLEFLDPPVGDWVDESTALNGAKDPTSTLLHLPWRRLDLSRAVYYALITHLDDRIGKMNLFELHGVMEPVVTFVDTPELA